MNKYWPNKHDEFSSSPFLSILPSFGGVQREKNHISSLYARFEKVNAQIRAIARDNEEDLRRLNAEKMMLENALEWLKVRTDEEKGDS